MTMWKYFTTLAGAIVVTLGTVALMMFAILLPYWYHFKDKYPTTDVGLFHECFNEGLNKGCHAFADNAVWVEVCRMLSVSSLGMLMLTVGLLSFILLTGRTTFLFWTMVATLFAGLVWIICLVMFASKFNPTSEIFQPGICIDMAFIIVMLLCIALLLICAVGYFSRDGVRNLMRYIRSLCGSPREEEYTLDEIIISTDEVRSLLQRRHTRNQAAGEQGPLLLDDIYQQEPISDNVPSTSSYHVDA